MSTDISDVFSTSAGIGACDITRRVRNFLNLHLTDFQALEIDANDAGIVTVRGVVPSARAKQRCFDYCRRITGVTAIVDELLVAVNGHAKSCLRQERLERTRINTIPALIAYVDAEQRYRFVNPAYCEQFLCSRQDLLGKTVRHVWGDRNYAKIAAHLNAALQGQSQHFEREFTFPNQDDVCVKEVFYEPDQRDHGTVVGCYVTMLDLTERIDWEEQLLEARNAAEEASRAKSAFVANMNHEIRTPMTAVLGYVDLLAAREQDPQKQQVLGKIKKNGQFLLEIINDILDLSKMEAGRLEMVPERFALSEVLSDLQAVMQVRAEEKQLAFTIEWEGPVPPTIVSDPKRLRQILINLVGNAMKFTTRGEVRVVIRSLADGPTPPLQFEVIDTGIGMTTAQMRGLFDPFTQGDSSIARAYGGTGLGLTISQRLAHLLGGGITVTSEPGKGSKFSCTIAMGEIEQTHSIEQGSIEQGSIEQGSIEQGSIEQGSIEQGSIEQGSIEQGSIEQGEQRLGSSPSSRKGVSPLHCRVLVVDDRREVRFLVRHFLEQAGARVQLAKDGLEALAKVRQAIAGEAAAIDLLLLDMKMPRLDGYATARQLRELGFYQPIIALTADTMAEDRQQCLACGCNAHLSKPIAADELMDVVSRLTQYAHLLQ